MIKLIAIDLDGTLYNSDHQLPPRGREAVRKAKDAGLQPVVVTGRGRRGAEHALGLLGIDIPYICSAGALVRPGTTGETWHAWTFHVHNEVLPVIELCRAHPSSGLIAETPDGSALWFGPDSLNDVMDPLTANEAYKSRRSLDPEKDFDRPLLKLTIAADPEILRHFNALVRLKCPSLHHITSGVNYIDMTLNGVNKGAALATLAERFELRPQDIAAIGDQAIDLKMLQFAGLPIAMSNAVPELKNMAKWIAPSNDNDGVAWAIEKILRRNED